MALRAVPDHPKFAAFKTLLKIPKGAALGWLEAIWHFTGRFTPQGNIGKYSVETIEAWAEWDGEPGALIDALVRTGWIDKDPVYVLLVHDWHEHADKATKNSLKRSRLPFCFQSVRTPSVQDTPISRLPEPEPEPVPEPEPGAVRAVRAPKSPGANGEFMLAGHIWQELNYAADNKDVEALSAVITAEARAARASPDDTAAQLLAWAQEAQACGEVINRFWFKDRRYTGNGNRKPKPKVDETFDELRRHYGVAH